MKRLLPLLGFLGMLWAGMGSGQAATCTLPYILQNGTIPNATQVMADFYALLNCINSGSGGGGGGQVFTCASASGICPFSIPMFWPGLPPANQVVRISLTDTVTCPANLPNSEGAAKTAATGSPVVNIYQVVSGTPTLVATATFSAGTATFAAASPINFAIGDVVQYQFPASPDATMADVSLTMHCNRTSGNAVGASGAPLPDGDIWVGNPSGVAQAQAPSGDLSMTDAGVFSVLKIHGTSVPASPTANQTILATSGTAATWGLIPNASLVNSATTVNGQTCTLGASCTVTASAATITVGTTTITAGTPGDILYDNAGVLGNLATTGSGNVVLATSPTVSGLTVTGSLTATGLITTADLAANAVTYAKIQSETASTLLGNPTGSGAVPSEITLGSGLAFSGTTLTASGSGGTVTSVAAGAGLTASPSPITGSGTISLDLTHANTWTGVQTFSNGDLSLAGSSSGNTLLEASATASGTITFPAATDTVDLIGTAQTFTAAKTFTNSDLKLLGSSTGATTFTSANASATNYTATLPAATDTIAELAATQTFTNKTITDSSNTVANGVVTAVHFQTGSSTGNTLTGPREYFVCTSTCTVTPPVPAAGYEFCVLNDDNTSTVITVGNPGSSVKFENTARTAYGTATTGTLTSGGAAGDMICIVGRDSTHYLSTNYVGTWTAS